ncbi:MAG: sigma-70 family RNA polymerase sigma factor [Rhodobacterales bacterium]|nr:sigma-70 family RNA polymerase sigma factor [Rhodobacterales bacterium]
MTDTWDQEAARVAAARSGDGQAFAALVAGLRDRVYRFVLRQVPRAEDAEDLTQETFLEAYRSLARFRGESRFSTWVLGIALNLARNHRSRRPEYRYRMVSDEALGGLADPAAGPHEDSRTAALARALDAGLAALPGDQREALTLVALDGLSYAEAAQVLDLPLGTVKTRVFRARAALKAGMEATGTFDLFTP